MIVSTHAIVEGDAMIEGDEVGGEGDVITQGLTVVPYQGEPVHFEYP